MCSACVFGASGQSPRPATPTGASCCGTNKCSTVPATRTATHRTIVSESIEQAFSTSLQTDALCGLLRNLRVFPRSRALRQHRRHWCGSVGMLVGIGRRMYVRNAVRVQRGEQGYGGCSETASTVQKRFVRHSAMTCDRKTVKLACEDPTVFPGLRTRQS